MPATLRSKFKTLGTGTVCELFLGQWSYDRHIIRINVSVDFCEIFVLSSSFSAVFADNFDFFSFSSLDLYFFQTYARFALFPVSNSTISLGRRLLIFDMKDYF